MIDDFSLDEAQSRAARAGDGPVVVVAGAGTGKTRTLVARVRVLTEERGVPPEAITIVTYTNKAAREILERTSSFLASGRRPTVATFHSLANRIIRAHPGLVGLTRRFAIIDDDDRETIVRNILKALDPGRDVPEFMRRIDGWKSSGLTAGHILSEERKPRSAMDERDASIFLSVEGEMRNRDMIDFGGLINECNRILADYQDLGNEISSGILHLLVDEAQDANPAQVRLARNLSRVHQNVFSVGDEDQSIFSFQGGRPGSLQLIAGKDPKVFRLERNRRSTDEILRPAVRLVANNRGSSSKVLSSGKIGEPPLVRDFPNEKAEASFVAQEIRSLIRQNIRPSEIAVLVRSTFASHAIEEAFVRMDLPYEILGGVNLASREEVRDVAAYFRLAVRPDDDLAFRRIASKPTRGVGPATEDAIVSFAQQRRITLAEACSRIDTIEGYEIPSALRESLSSFGEALSWLDVGFSRQGWSALDILHHILADDGIGYETFSTRKNDAKARRRKNVLDTLRGLALACGEPAELMDRIAFGDEDQIPESADLVRISTMHSSKGLEWDHVFLPSFEAGVVPSPRTARALDHGDAGDVWSGAPTGGLEEERRLAHVALTRAKRNLTITYPTTRKGRKTTESSFLHEAGLRTRESDIYGYDDFDPFEGGKKDLGFAPAPASRRAGKLSGDVVVPVRRKR